MNEQAILTVLPQSIRQLIRREFEQEGDLQEIRLRAGRPLLLTRGGREFRPGNENYIVSREEIGVLMEHVSHYSMYAFEEELRQGFITIEGGHRIGIAGQAVVEQERISHIRHISSVNIRIAHEIPGCADRVLPRVVKSGRLCHTLLVSPPGCGKTTLLRDMIRQISDGNALVRGVNVGVIDERSEIAGCYRGVPQNHLGIRTDVMDGCPKAEGMIRMIRSMRPQVLAVDEIGEAEDVHAVSYAMHCGCRMLATAHGESMEELSRRPVFAKMIGEKRFERYVFLRGQGEIESVCDENGGVIET